MKVNRVAEGLKVSMEMGEYYVFDNLIRELNKVSCEVYESDRDKMLYILDHKENKIYDISHYRPISLLEHLINNKTSTFPNIPLSEMKDTDVYKALVEDATEEEKAKEGLKKLVADKQGTKSVETDELVYKDGKLVGAKKADGTFVPYTGKEFKEGKEDKKDKPKTKKIPDSETVNKMMGSRYPLKSCMRPAPNKGKVDEWAEFNPNLKGKMSKASDSVNFELSFKMDSAAFDNESPEMEISRILDDIKNKLSRGMKDSSILDVNGNVIGEWQIKG